MKKGWVTYQEAKQMVRARGIQTHLQYEKWHKAQKPRWIPRHPHQSYKEWESWPLFLGTNNVYAPYRNRTVSLLNYWEATRYVQSLKLKNEAEYISWWVSEKPAFLPKYPYSHYRSKGLWQGWNHFLGKTAIVRERPTIEEDVSVFAIIKDASLPFNVFHIIIEEGGQHILGEQARENNWQIVKCFKWDKELAARVNNILASNASKYYNEKAAYTIPNIHGLLWDLSEVLDIKY